MKNSSYMYSIMIILATIDNLIKHIQQARSAVQFSVEVKIQGKKATFYFICESNKLSEWEKNIKDQFYQRSSTVETDKGCDLVS